MKKRYIITILLIVFAVAVNIGLFLRQPDYSAELVRVEVDRSYSILKTSIIQRLNRLLLTIPQTAMRTRLPLISLLIQSGSDLTRRVKAE